MASLTWLGHSAFLVVSDEGKRIYIDPFLNGNPSTPDELKTPEHVDVIALTHGHGDHVGDTVALSQAFPDAHIFAILELKTWLGSKGANVGHLPGLNKGGTQEVDGIHFTLVNAFHTSTSDAGEYLGEPCGKRRSHSSCSAIHPASRATTRPSRS
jgi:L-ascorbate metabolism protein UlaG (beta-lactamase superfamily)